MEIQQEIIITDPTTTTVPTLTREEIIKQYVEQFGDKYKSEICRFFLRGVCIFPTEKCKMAHTIEELKVPNIELRFKGDNKAEPEISETKDKEATKDNEEDDEKQEEDGTESKKRKFTQPSIGLERSYDCLYETQLNLVKDGLWKDTDIIPLEELNVDGAKRRNLRKVFHPLMSKQLITRLFKLHGHKYLPKSYIEKVFGAINWKANWSYFIDYKFAYEVKNKETGPVILLMPSQPEVEHLMEECLIKIIASNAFIDYLPVSPSIISKHFYKDILAVDPLIPNLFVFLKGRNENLDQYLQKLQKEPKFIEKMITMFTKDKITHEMPIFENVGNELKRFHEKIIAIIQQNIKSNELGLVPYSKIENAVLNECKLEITQFSNNTIQVKKRIRQVALSHKILPIHLQSELFYFSLDHSKNQKHDAASFKQFCTKVMDKCSLNFISSHKNTSTNNSPTTNSPIDNNNNGNSPNTANIAPTTIIISPDTEKFEESLETQIDMRKVVVVDSKESLDIAKEYLKTVTEVGVDLEGQLEKDGMVELVQISANEKIFIFDVLGVNKQAQNGENIESADCKALAKNLALVIKEVMENENILKVFHDCRRDSLALHVLLNSCVRNVIDVSAVHTFIQNLQKYLRFADVLHLADLTKIDNKKKPKENEIQIEQEIEIQKSFEDINRPPGLNDIFSEYQVSHGLNKLKHIMKKRFSSFPREYFTNRPIDKEFLVYSAKDVEDLVEAKNNILKKLAEVMGKIFGEIDELKVLMAALVVSRSYSNFGWVGEVHCAV
jgi:hypothetical protein